MMGGWTISGCDVAPVDDLKVHVHGMGCWCKPVLQEGIIVVHNSADGREAFETGERKVS